MSFASSPWAIVPLIFGGCCSNVFALEAILKRDADSGLLITLTQFILTTIFAFSSQYDASQPSLFKKTTIPFKKLAISAAMFYTVNMLNNWAFAFHISVPVHIILRSFGSVTTMAAGYLRGKRYSPVQVFSVLLLTVGVLVSAWADASSKGKSMSANDIDLTSKSFEMGLAVLLAAQILSAYMGAYTEDMYATHGKRWDENLFYSHFLSLPLFFPLTSTLRTQFTRLTLSPPLLLPMSLSSQLPLLLQKALNRLPESVFMLLLNATTQLACISGVNLLSANASAVTVTIVLNVRKLVSFMFSIWLFGNPLSGQMLLGAILVFGSGALYGWETSFAKPRRLQSRGKQVHKGDSKKVQ